MAYDGRYDTPADILHSDDLTRGEKIELLELWRDDKKAHLRASGDGMAGTPRADLFKEIKKVLAVLQT